MRPCAEGLLHRIGSGARERSPLALPKQPGCGYGSRFHAGNARGSLPPNYAHSELRVTFANSDIMIYQNGPSSTAKTRLLAT